MSSVAPSVQKPKHIMMSYCWKGMQDLVYEVAEQLTKHNIPVWMDIRNGLGGSLYEGMAAAVENSAAVCFFLTPEYQESRSCKRELEYADKLGIPLIACRCCADFKPSSWLGIISASLLAYDFRDLSERPINRTLNKLTNYIQTNIYKIDPTNFPDIDGRTAAVIFRSRGSFVSQDTDEEQPMLPSSTHTSPTPNLCQQSERVLLCATVNISQGSVGSELSTTSSNGSHVQATGRRATFSEDEEDSIRMLVPLESYEDYPLVSLEAAIEPVLSFFDQDIRPYALITKQNSREPVGDLTSDEAASIQLYSMQWPPMENTLYIHLNRALWTTNRQALRPWFPYLKLFLTALNKLPSSRTTVWRGVQGDLRPKYRKGQSVIWWGISSCVSARSVIEQLLGDSGPRTIFSIEVQNAKSIREYPYFKDEEEIILLPGTYLQVVDGVRAAPNLTIIHMKELTYPYSLIAPPWRRDAHPEQVKHVHDSSDSFEDMISEDDRHSFADEALSKFRAWRSKTRLFNLRKK